MKKLSLVLFLSFSVLFVSCEKDGDESEKIAIEETNLIGEWQVTGYLQEDGKSTSSLDGESVTFDFTAVGKDYDMTVTFNDDPRTVVSNGSYGVVLTTTFLGQSQTQETTAFTAFEASEWRMENETIFFINDGEETEVVVSEFTDSKIVMSFDFNQSVMDALSGVQTDASGTVTITLEK